MDVRRRGRTEHRKEDEDKEEGTISLALGVAVSEAKLSERHRVSQQEQSTAGGLKLKRFKRGKDTEGATK